MLQQQQVVQLLWRSNGIPGPAGQDCKEAGLPPIPASFFATINHPNLQAYNMNLT